MSNPLERQLAAEALAPDPALFEPDQHSRDNAARMLADPNYPTEYERASFMYEQRDAHFRKMAGNLLAMLDEARKGDSAT